MSLDRQIRRNKRKEVYNTVLNKFDHYRKSKRGRWIMVYPHTNTDVRNAPTLNNHEIEKLAKT